MSVKIHIPQKKKKKNDYFPAHNRGLCSYLNSEIQTS